MRVAVSAWQEANRHYGSARGDPDGWRSASGARPVCLSAPHAVKHVRDGAEKGGDLRTGGLAECCANALGARFLASNGRQSGDPNWDSGHPYRQRLLSLAAGAAVLDLHGMRDGHGVDVCLGLGAGAGAWERQLAGALVELALSCGIERVAVNHPFTASPRSLTSFLQSQGVPGLEIEIARSLREFEGDAGGAARTLAFVVGAVEAAAHLAPAD